MSALVDVVNQLLNIPTDTLGKLKNLSNSHIHDAIGGKHSGGGNSISTIPVDILETPKEYVFYMDFPGLSKSDIQVTVEDNNILVIQSNGGKRKRVEIEEDDGCKYMILERRRPPKKVTRKFRLPDDANTSAITAKCENGVLTVVVEKLPPPPKPKTKNVEIPIS